VLAKLPAVKDTITTLGPAVLERIGEVRKHVEEARGHLEALMESISPTDTKLKRQVTARLTQAGEEIERVLDHLDGAETSASGTTEPDAQP
jgi:hypothetical protein